MDNKKTKIIALFGKAGAGKDTLKHWMTTNIPNTNGIICCTTRPPRQHEVDGADYDFITVEEFTQKLIDGYMIEASEFNAWFYGTCLDRLDDTKINIGIFNINGIECILDDNRFDVLPVLIRASDKSRLLRQLNRENDPDCKEICRRFLADEKDFLNIPFDYVCFDNNPDCHHLDTFHIDSIPEIHEFIYDVGQK